MVTEVCRCQWVDAEVAPMAVLRTALVVLLVVVPLRLVLLEPCVQWLLTSPHADGSPEETPSDTQKQRTSALSPPVPVVSGASPSPVKRGRVSPLRLSMQLQDLRSLPSPSAATYPAPVAMSPQPQAPALLDGLSSADYCRFDYVVEVRGPQKVKGEAVVTASLSPRSQRSAKDIFELFLNDLLRHRDKLRGDRRSRFEALWHLQGSAFEPSVDAPMPLRWRLRTCPPGPAALALADYLLRRVEAVEARALQEARLCCLREDKTGLRILSAFAEDLLGLDSADCLLFRQHSVPHLTEPSPVKLSVKAAVMAALLGANAALAFASTRLSTAQPPRQTLNWFYVFMAALCLDLMAVETADNLWSHYWRPRLFSLKGRAVQRTIVSLAARLSAERRQSHSFDCSRVFFVSRHLAEAFPSTEASRVVLSFALTSPASLVPAPRPLTSLSSLLSALTGVARDLGCLPVIAQRLVTCAIALGVAHLPAYCGGEGEVSMLSLSAAAIAGASLFAVCLGLELAYWHWERFRRLVDSLREEPVRGERREEEEQQEQEEEEEVVPAKSVRSGERERETSPCALHVTNLSCHVNSEGQ